MHKGWCPFSVWKRGTMDNEVLADRIRRIRGYDIGSFNETQAKNSIIEPVFNCLQWDTSDPNEVVLEYNMSSGGRVDYAFMVDRQPVILVEAKQPRESLENHAEQLLRYAFDKGVQLAVLTNGIEWWLYLPMEGGDWATRKFYSIDLTTQEIDDVCERFIEFLTKDNVISGRSLENAKQMRRSRERQTKIRATLPEVWHTIITEPNEILVDLLVEETERKCGFKPDESRVKDFIAGRVSRSEPAKPRIPIRRIGDKAKVQRSNHANYINKQVEGFTFLGKTVRVRFCYEILLRICEMMLDKHPNRFEKVLLSLRKRKYPCFSRNLRDLMQKQGKKIQGTDVYAATKMHNDAMIATCRKVIESFGYDPDDLKIEPLDSERA